jgi:PTS system ascorbate-specific IIA component
MSIGVLIITHSAIGPALLETASKMLGRCPLVIETLSVTNGGDVELMREQAHGMVRELDQGDGVLVLTDMYGSTPSNIAAGLQKDGKINVVAGINLPMLVRVLNYPVLDLATLAEKALSGGRDGILLCKRPT